MGHYGSIEFMAMIPTEILPFFLSIIDTVFTINHFTLAPQFLHWCAFLSAW
jgi:hypothetical protein